MSFMRSNKCVRFEFVGGLHKFMLSRYVYILYVCVVVVILTSVSFFFVFTPVLYLRVANYHDACLSKSGEHGHLFTGGMLLA